MPTRIVGKNADMGITAATTLLDAPFTFSQLTMLGKRMSTFTINMQLNTEESTAYQTEAGAVADWKEFEVIDGNWQVDFEAFFNTATAPDVAALFADPALLFGKRGWTGYPNGRNATMSATNPRYSGRVLIQSAPVSLPRSGLAKIRGNFQGDSTLVRTATGTDT